MSEDRSPFAGRRTLAGLVRDLGAISLERILLDPPPRTATVEDVIKTKCCELIDGVLVEKVPDFAKSILGTHMTGLLWPAVHTNGIGIITGPSGPFQLRPGLVRLPDIAVTLWERIPNRRLPVEPAPQLAPDLAIDFICKGTTAGEMSRKREEYFTVGVQLVWEIDRFNKVVTVYTSPTNAVTRAEGDFLDGGSVLPGFSLPVRDIFAQLERHG